MTFNLTASVDLINRTLYSKDFYSKLQKGRIITSIFTIAACFVAIILLLCGMFVDHKSTAFKWLVGIGISLILFQLLFTLIRSIWNTHKIKKFVNKRYSDWIIKYYLICSENFSNFEINETLNQNEFACEYYLHKFALFIDKEYIKITKENAEVISFDNRELNLFNHPLSFKEKKLISLGKDYYFQANDFAAKAIASFIESDIKYVLAKAYGNS